MSFSCNFMTQLTLTEPYVLTNFLNVWILFYRKIFENHLDNRIGIYHYCLCIYTMWLFKFTFVMLLGLTFCYRFVGCILPTTNQAARIIVQTVEFMLTRMFVARINRAQLDRKRFVTDGTSFMQRFSRGLLPTLKNQMQLLVLQQKNQFVKYSNKILVSNLKSRYEPLASFY